MRTLFIAAFIVAVLGAFAQNNSTPATIQGYDNGNRLPTPAEVIAKNKISKKRLSQSGPQLKTGGGNAGSLFTTGPEQDCAGAIAVCQQTYTEPNSYTGYGSVQEVYGTCLLNREQYSVWYVFTVQNNGDFSFTIQTQNDYDFALYDITTIGCAGVPSAAPVRCNYSGTYGNTGLSLPPSNTVPMSYGAGSSPMMPGLNVSAGSTYALIIDNWTQDNNGYTISFAGSASIFDVTPPAFSAVAQICSGFDQVTVTFDEPIDCSSIQSNGADFTLSGPSGAVTITGAAGAGCTGTLTSQATITFDNSTQVPSGTYTLTHVGGLLDKCGTPMNNGETITFDYLAPISISPSATEVCLGNSATLTATGGPASGATFSWSPGSSTGSSLVVTPTVSTSYSVSVSYGNCTGSATQVIAIGATPVVSVTPMNLTLCSGTTPITATATINGNVCTDCDFSWTGSTTQTDLNTSSSVIANADTGVYTVNVTSAIGCPGTQATTVISGPNSPPTPTCNVIYVEPSGTGTGFTRTSPTNLLSALSLAQCNSIVIKMKVGLYTISNPITTLTSFVSLEGGYDATFSTKSSQAGSTTISRDANNVQGQPTAGRLTGFELTAQSNFRLQDLTIEVADAPSATASNPLGITNYGLYLSACSNYEIVRCVIDPGNSSDGYSPAAGSTISNTGGNGGSGGSQGSGCNGGGTSGGSGSAGSGGGGSGGSAGSGGPGDGCNIFNCNASSSNGGPGSPGQPGSIGSPNYTIGDKPTTNVITGTHFIPNGQSANGGNGTGGGGGGGGGGGAIGTCCLCSCGSGDASGGTGGIGGNAGGAGSGGNGGGGCFGVFLYNNGGGSFIDCDIATVSNGSGGLGSAGGTGATGSNGASGGSHSRCGGTSGGDGGDGGNGGNGGRGRDGADGTSAKLYLNGVSPSYELNGGLITLNAGANSPTTFGLASQAEIIVDNISCTNTDIDHSTPSGSPSWALTADATPNTGSTSPLTAQYSAVGYKTIVMGSDIYTDFLNVLVSSSTTGSIIASSSTICPDTASFSYSAAGPLGLSYSWSVSPQADSILSADSSFTQIDFSGTTSTTTYVVTLDISSDCCGQLPPLTTSITVIPAETPIAVNDTVCEGGTATLYATNGPGFTYNWYDQATGGTLLATDSAFTVTGATATTTYYVESVSALGCIGNRTAVTLVVTPLPAPTAANIIVCDTGWVFITVDPVPGATAYNWYDQPTGPPLLQSNNSFSYAVYISAPGTKTVYVSYTIPGCAESPRTMVTATVDNNIITYNPTLDTICAGGSVDLDAGEGGGTGSFTYLWSPINTADSVLANPTVSPTTSTSYSVIITSGPCAVTVNIPVIVSGQLDPNFTVTDIACNGDGNGSITASPIGGIPPLTYQWDGPAGSGTDSSVTGLSGGTYLVTITDVGGCTQTDSATINEPTVLALSASATDANCGNQDGDASVNATGGTAPYTYLWDDGGAQTTATANSLGGGNYTVLVTDTMGCQDTASVTVVDVPLTATVSSDTTFCEGGTAQLTAGGGNIFSWSTGETSAAIIVSPAVSTTYTVVVSSAVCPADTATVTVTVNPAPTVSVAPSSITIIQGSSTELTATGAASYDWSTGDATATITVTPDSTTTYWVTGTDEQGCSDSTSVTVNTTTYENVVYLPNVFSPVDENGDNQTLQVFGSNIGELSLVIYDRWGEMVYESTDAAEATRSDGKCCAYGKGWNGSWENSGSKINVAAFAYILRGKFKNGDEFEKQGNITLIK